MAFLYSPVVDVAIPLWNEETPTTPPARKNEYKKSRNGAILPSMALFLLAILRVAFLSVYCQAVIQHRHLHFPFHALRLLHSPHPDPRYFLNPLYIACPGWHQSPIIPSRPNPFCSVFPTGGWPRPCQTVPNITPKAPNFPSASRMKLHTHPPSPCHRRIFRSSCDGKTRRFSQAKMWNAQLPSAMSQRATIPTPTITADSLLLSSRRESSLELATRTLLPSSP